MNSSTNIAADRSAGVYSVARCPGPLDLFLDANEGPPGCVDLGALAAELGPDAARRYPKVGALEREIARRWRVDPEAVVVTAGADEAIDRICRALLGPGREIVMAAPTFEMIGRYAARAGATVVEVPWLGGEYPLRSMIEATGPRTGLIAVVSPNNPTGGVVSGEDLACLAAAAPHAALLVDVAYAEFADEDLTAAALAQPNAVVVRTFSKAFGLAGLRVGYAIAPLSLARRLRGCGSPYPVAGLSLAAAAAALGRAGEWLPGVVTRVRRERERLEGLLVELGADAIPSQGNFVLAEFSDAEWAWRGLGGLGIAVRRFSPGSSLEPFLRVTCPTDEDAFGRLERGLRAVLRPRGLLLDMDGVLADVSGSYRRAIVETAATFGVELGPEDIRLAKREPGSNNDWIVTQRLLAGRGIRAELSEVTARFESLYLGSGGRPGLDLQERLIPSRGTLERLAARVPLGIVTGRPRRDCERFLERFGVGDLFATKVCMEDGPAKPDPSGLRRALAEMGLESAWMVGDTPDDLVAARAAGVVPVGVCPPGEDGEGSPLPAALEAAGAARVLRSLDELEGMLP